MRLPGYFGFLRKSGLWALVGFALLIAWAPASYFAFFIDKDLVVFGLLFFFVLISTLFYFQEKMQSRAILLVLDVIWSFFQFFIIWESGGVTSPLMLLLVFPLLAATFDLRPERVLWIGIANLAVFALLITLQPQYWNNGSILMQHAFRVIFLALITGYIVKIVEDTLRQRYQKQEADKKYFQLSEVDQVKSDFIMVVSHQLRTPLTAARYALHEFESSTDQTLREAYVHQATKRIDASTDMVNEMLKSIELGSLSMRRDWQALDLATLMGEVINELQFECERSHAIVHATLDDALPVFGSREMLKVAFSHVLENAIRYGHHGGVDIVATKNDNQVIVDITDRGIGIETNDQPHVFDRFYRAKNAMQLYPNESGIGLFTAKSIFNRHSGDIKVLVSKHKLGTTMRIELPLHK